MNHKMLTMNDVFPGGILGNGVFTRMSNPPWVGTMSSDKLDMILFADCGEKYISPLVRRFVTDSNPVITVDDSAILANLILDTFEEQWKRKYALLSEVYDPIKNYDMQETETASKKITDTVNESDNHTVTLNETVKDTGTVKATTKTNIYGFNSTKGQPSDDGNGTNTTDMTNARTGTNTDNITKTGNTSRDDSENRTLTRSGNIGVTTSQQMIQSEIDLWDWNYYKDVIVDVMNMLTLSTY